MPFLHSTPSLVRFQQFSCRNWNQEGMRCTKAKPSTPEWPESLRTSTRAGRHNSHQMRSIYTAISIKVVGLTQAYATRPKGNVGGCKSVLVSRLSEVGQKLRK